MQYKSLSVLTVPVNVTEVHSSGLFRTTLHLEAKGGLYYIINGVV